MINPPRSAYLHIPFCHRRCFYCDFSIVPLGNSVKIEGEPGLSAINAYLDLIHREIDISTQGPPLSTIYIGGGTPSLLTPLQINSLLRQLEKKFGIQYGAEITMEIDPATFSKQDLDDYLSIGINRVSLGAQSFENDVLVSIGRTHNYDQIVNACFWINEMFRGGRLLSWNLDLIQNLPGSNLHTWENQLRQAIDSFAPHLSIYDLEIEPHTVFGRKYIRGDLNLPDEDLAADINIKTAYYLSNAGFSQYEISNYSLPGHPSRHNRMYWSGSGWWGFGMGATSAPWGQRLARPKTIVSYQKWIEKQENEGLDPTLFPVSARRMPLDELLMIGLRRREGVHLEELAKTSGWDQSQCDRYLFLLKENWQYFLNQGLLVEVDGNFRLSNPYGMAVSNQIFIQMMMWWESLPSDVVSLPSL